MDYDMIIGRETLIGLGIGIDFKEKQMTWNDIKVEMKDPTLFDIKDHMYLFSLQANPQICQQTLARAKHILNAGRVEE